MFCNIPSDLSCSVVPVQKIREKGLANIPGILDNTVHTSVCCDVYVYITVYIYSYTAARPGLCRVVCLTVTALKESIYEAFILAAYGFWQVVSRAKL